MMKKRKYTRLLALILMAMPLLWGSCSMMGKQPPVWEGGSFTPDGRYYVYVYSIYNVRNYESSGGYTRTSGPTDFYFQVIDCATGEKVLKSPIQTRKRLEIGVVDDAYVWLTTFVPKDQEHGVAIFDIGKMEMTFEDKDVRRLNPNIPFTHARFHENNSGRPGAVYQAADGRNYAIDGATAQFTPVEVEPWTSLGSGDADFYQYVTSIEGIRLEGSTRRRLVWTDSTAIQSEDDFISPEFLALTSKGSNWDEEPLTIYEGSFFVLSPQLTTSSVDMLLTRVDQETLRTVWSLPIPQDYDPEALVPASTSNKSRVALRQDTLLIANQTHLLKIDPRKGNVMAAYYLLR